MKQKTNVRKSKKQKKTKRKFHTPNRTRVLTIRRIAHKRISYIIEIRFVISARIRVRILLMCFRSTHTSARCTDDGARLARSTFLCELARITRVLVRRITYRKYLINGVHRVRRTCARTLHTVYNNTARPSAHVQ